MKYIKTMMGFLVLVQLIIIGNLIYIYPGLGFSPIPSQWGVGSGYGRDYIINNGKIFSHETSLTWQSDIVNYAGLDIFPKVLSAMVSIVTGQITSYESERFNQIFPWVGIIFLPLCLLYFYAYISKKNGTFDNMDALIIYLFGMFPLASTLTSMSLGLSAANTVARSLFLLILVMMVILFDQGKRDSLRTLSFIILITSFFYYHHTWSYYAIIYIALVGIISIFTKQKPLIGLSLIAVVVFLNAAIFYDTNLKNEIFRIVKSFPNILINFPSVSHTSQINDRLLGYNTFGSIYSYLQIINSIIILLIFLAYVIFYLKYLRNNNAKKYEKMLFYYSIIEFFVFLALFIWDGFQGIYSRILEALVYLSLLLAAYFLVKLKGKNKVIFRLSLIFTAFIAIFSFLIAPSELNMRLTNEEYTGLQFAGLHVPQKAYTFSDFRLTTPLIYFNHKGISSLDSPRDSPDITEQILVQCFYNVSNPEYVLDRKINSTKYYFLSSSHQSEVYLLDTSLIGFKPASRDFQESWNTQKSFNNIYTSKYVEIFERKEKD